MTHSGGNLRRGGTTHEAVHRWWQRIVCVGICLGAYWSASGLLQFHEVFFSPATSSSAPHTPLATPASSSALQPTRQYDRLVVVLIDALRADMVVGSDAMYGRTPQADTSVRGAQDLSQHMQFTRGLLASGQAAAYVAHASVPTVTMPRLKALLSGKPPAFIDILKNFNSVALADENVVQLMRENGFRIVFYGDDTWLKLFPDAFQRSEGTSGFYTRDTSEVDDNVTRHLRDELDPLMKHHKSQDWDVLVLHYLGLDHVGHLRGPRSLMMKDKLHEMDDVVKLVYESVLSQDKARRDVSSEAKPTLITLCSDHGMSEIGNHGGATVEESSALMAFIRGDGMPLREDTAAQSVERRLQVDLVPTIATLFGLRIPVLSTGLLLEGILRSGKVSHPSSTTIDSLKALYANLVQLRTLARVKFAEVEAVTVETADLENRVLRRIESAATSQEGDGILIRELLAACQGLQAKVARSDGSEYNLALIASGVGVLLTCAASSTLLAARLVRRGHLDCKGVTARVSLVAFVLTIVSLTSTSSIENEHATVYLVTTSLLVALILENRIVSCSRVQIAAVAGCLLCVRLLRERCQVINFARLNDVAVDTSIPGNEFAADDSLSIWFTGPLFSTLEVPQEVLFAAIYAVTLWSTYGEWKQRRASPSWFKALAAIFSLGMSATVWCARLIRSECPRTRVDFAARCVYGAAIILVGIGARCRGPCGSISAQMSLWLLTSTLQKPSNLPSLAVLSLLLAMLSATCRARPATSRDPFIGLWSVWFASAAFFSLGNSHLVTTIDISQSYHGLDGYSQEIVGLLTFINVFSGPLLVFASYHGWKRLPGSAKSTSTSENSAAMWIVLSYLAFRMAAYTIIVFFMRFHLFIWSVFAPKMLYEVVSTVVGAVFAVTM